MDRHERPVEGEIENIWINLVGIVQYVIPAGECPKKVRVIQVIRNETVADFYSRIREDLGHCDIISIRLEKLL